MPPLKPPTPSVAGGCARVLEAIRACCEVTRPNHCGRANFMVRYKHHLRDARKRHDVDARHASPGASSVRLNGTCELKAKRQRKPKPKRYHVKV